MVEPEMAYADLEDVKRVGEEMVLFVIGRVLENRQEDLKVLERDVSKLEAVRGPFPRMSYDDAVVKLQSKGSEIQWGGDFGNTDETLLGTERSPDRPVMVDRYPASVSRRSYFQRPCARSARGRVGRRFYRARRLWRDYRRRPAHS